jgi:uncharacterized membrane protein
MKASKASNVAYLGITIALMVVIQFLSTIVYAVWPLPIQPVFIHIPVIIGSMLFGWKKGAFLGFMMGLILFIHATISAGVTNYMFTPFHIDPATQHGNPWSIVVTFLPRILIGIVPWFVFKAFSKNTKLGAALGGLAGTLTNTILVLGLIYFIFIKAGAGQTLDVILSAIISLNGAVEILSAVILSAAIVPVLKKITD